MSQQFDGSQQLFRIGLSVLDPHDWIEIDDRLDLYLAEKRRLAAAHFDEICVAEPGSEAAQREALDLIAGHLTAHFPEIYARRGNGIVIGRSGASVDLDREPALWHAALLVPDDLLLLRKDEAGWRLIAGALAFPSSWRLRDKIGMPIGQVHAPVPEFGTGTRNDSLINRMFDNMRPETRMLRYNWSVYGVPDLYHPEPDETEALRLGDDAEAAFLRVERQTLRLLPQTGTILFTVKVIVDPLARLAADPGRFQVCQRLAEQLRGLDEAQLAYKGLTSHRDRLVARLDELRKT
ncbi:MAG: DUF3445 domain-containing protein [Hyphomicrobiaceae bacterium]|nr:DUF3445 domain-containing protein [Hyphomicrobiaceae bacterium]